MSSTMNLTSETATEKALLAIWRDIFPAAEIGVESDFFDLGGNSLTAIVLLTRVEERLGQDVLPPETLFSSGSLRELAAAIEGTLEARRRDAGAA